MTVGTMCFMPDGHGTVPVRQIDLCSGIQQAHDHFHLALWIPGGTIDVAVSRVVQWSTATMI